MYVLMHGIWYIKCISKIITRIFIENFCGSLKYFVFLRAIIFGMLKTDINMYAFICGKKVNGIQ